mmetsp:Transcript_54814/g.133126  ORF Transcript_54814/g.133126 Transcript_54814/m.133126 type:complete len:167 (+) Transcript_54814:970-1470(+)
MKEFKTNSFLMFYVLQKCKDCSLYTWNRMKRTDDQVWDVMRAKTTIPEQMLHPNSHCQHAHPHPHLLIPFKWDPNTFAVEGHDWKHIVHQESKLMANLWPSSSVVSDVHSRYRAIPGHNVILFIQKIHAFIIHSIKQEKAGTREQFSVMTKTFPIQTNKYICIHCN